MRFPWSKTKEAESSVMSSDSSVQERNAPVRTDGPASTELISHEKRAVNSDTITANPAIQSEPAAAADPENIAQSEKHEELNRTVTTATTSSDPGGGPGEDDESKYATGLPLHLLTLGLVLSTFVFALDNTIIATAIPKITTVFNSLDDVGWYGSSYLLTTTSLQPSFGKVYTYFNVKWTYMLALLIFEFGSVLCGAAVNSTMLIVGRAVAGCGAAALFSGGMTIIGYSVPLRKRPIYIGLLSSLFGVASVVGPLLGGAFTDRTLKISRSLQARCGAADIMFFQEFPGAGAFISISPSAPSRLPPSSASSRTPNANIAV